LIPYVTLQGFAVDPEFAESEDGAYDVLTRCADPAAVAAAKAKAVRRLPQDLCCEFLK